MESITNLPEPNVEEQEATLVPQEWNQNNNTGRREVLVSVRHISKKFCRKLRRSMAYGITDLSKNLLGIKPDTSTLRQDEFWALDDVSFELRTGERLGIIGVNGSGKTTLLRLLTGIFPPDRGEIMVKGRVGALVAVGAGFHPHMTGRENIYLNGTILSMRRKEIQSKFESIVEFAEIREFLDAPVSIYSSGMRVRLGFSIALHCAPDILLVDEVLSVGDISFRNKSLRRMNDYREQANAVIFVSHQLEQIRVLCNRVIILDKGKIQYDGDTHQGIIQYEEMTRKYSVKTKAVEFSDFRMRESDNENLEFLEGGILNSNFESTDSIHMQAPLRLFCKFRAKKHFETLYFGIGVVEEVYFMPCIWVSSNDNNKFSHQGISPGVYQIVVQIDEHHLKPDIYYLNFAIRNDKTGETYERAFLKKPFRVVSDGEHLKRGIIAVEEQWSLEKIGE